MKGKGTAAVALDIKGAFNALLASAIVEELIRAEVPERILNFVSFMVSKRLLNFHENTSQPRICGVVVPHQGGGGIITTAF